MDPGLKDILFIDIETVSALPNKSELPERLQHLWDKKAVMLRNAEELSADELYQDRAAIYAEFGKVVCIGMGFLFEQDGKTVLRLGEISGHDEVELLSRFSKLLQEKFPKDLPRLCAHNGFEFDFPYLCRRLLIHQMPIPNPLNLLINTKPWNNPHIDTLEMWKFGDRKNFTSLDLLAAVFDVQSSKSDIDGSMVSKVYHQEQDLARIVRYCVRDVEVLCRVYLRMSGSNVQIDSVTYPDTFDTPEQNEENPQID